LAPVLATAIGIVALSDVAAADEALCLDGPREAIVAATVLSGDEIRLADGRTLRFAGAEAPRPPLSDTRPAARAAALRLAAEATAALAARIEGRDLEFLDVGEDRWGRRLGHLVDISGGQWIDGDLVGDGRLRAMPIAGDGTCSAALLVREAAARDAGRGLWREPLFAVRPADHALIERVGDLVVAEGIVRSVGRSRGRTWLNFGEDISRDFAVVMNDNDRSRFERAGFVLDDLKGRRVRVRGLLGRRAEAPRMAIDDPLAIERLER
jgi:endonuclease YncB( thermonuclease family)